MAEPLFSQCSFASLLVYGPYKKRANKKAGGETAGLSLSKNPRGWAAAPEAYRIWRHARHIRKKQESLDSLYILLLWPLHDPNPAYA